MAVYMHGTYGEFAPSIGRAATSSGTVAVYVGTAPVNLIRGFADAGVINEPVYLTSLSGVRRTMGNSKAWDKFTLCEAFGVHFDNEIANVGPIVAINVLDPAKHKKSAETTQQLIFANGRATIDSDTIILDTLLLANLVEGVDFSIDYDFTKSQVIIESIGDTDITGTVPATFSEVEPAAVTTADIVGGVTANGVYTGLGCVSLVYTSLNLITNLIAVPGWSQHKDVYSAMVKASMQINGHWNAMVVADIPLVDNSTAVDTIEKAIAWKSENGYTSERAKVCWPKAIDTSGVVYHLSTLWVWRQMLVDAEHDGVPMESASNKAAPVAKQFFGEASTNRGFDQQRGNELNAEGISTVVFFGGLWVLWGPHTAAFRHGAITDNRNIFDVSIRMMMHQLNSFQQEWALTIDSPMTRALADTIKNREQEKADALASMGALIGTPEVRFDEDDNSTDELVQGNFVWAFRSTPTPPFKSGLARVSYTTEGFTSFIGEEG